MDGSGTGWNNVFLPCIRYLPGKLPLSGDMKWLVPSIEGGMSSVLKGLHLRQLAPWGEMGSKIVGERKKYIFCVYELQLCL